jgi:hypothetical protein
VCPHKISYFSFRLIIYTLQTITVHSEDIPLFLNEGSAEINNKLCVRNLLRISGLWTCIDPRRYTQLQEQLRWKPEGRGFDSQLVIWIFHLFNSSDHVMPLGSTQIVTEMSARAISGGKGSLFIGLSNVSVLCADFIEILGAWNFWRTNGLSRPVMGHLQVYHICTCLWRQYSKTCRSWIICILRHVYAF